MYVLTANLTIVFKKKVINALSIDSFTFDLFISNFQFYLGGKRNYNRSNVKSAEINTEIVIVVVPTRLAFTMTHC